MKQHHLQETALRYFLDVVRTGSISVSSERLNVAGSAISRQIAGLESALDTALFERRSRGMVATAAGEMLAAYASRVALEADRIVQDIEALHGVRRGKVRLASSDGGAIEFLPHVMAAFRADYPGIHFSLAVSAPSEVTRRVREGDVDIGLVFSRTTHTDIRVAHRSRAPVMAVMRSGHPLARFGRVSLAQLCGYPLALPDTNTTIRQLFDIAASQQRLAFEPAVVSNYAEPLHNLAALTDTVSIAAEVTIRHRAARGELVAVPIRDRGLGERYIEVQTLVGRTLPKVVQIFLDFLCARL
ncbi:LysR substrate-binding domain-containing protein [Paraburkholderia silvatlantica]|uniref:DNA-binding transcriptional LysR family regulator n=1 Tax=Paraburkholderia silvatlantica TaxID=321895 RepID=A0A2U1A9I2_9BURK|nr:LysR substrate-binding domain-containing protein [Paraburkholderia silvatlantica]MBB2930505.1 DNA-binding transcriptional LysR family regulator [Paraburkholderia silvatlantica]PVY30312.1 DNA-binding transcriptional LysR family regulator [Paraburkholderia silvatlantica]PXW36952.1 DNA-binding transcriptional LysR family regulator [Paraburkholderia silvatlantica]PYE21291.1 DNA-binding transcriptional LysR family regulator [Paraburkholderia silvatlantica]TDQ86568.1 DNA-binding transcriptional L